VGMDRQNLKDHSPDSLRECFREQGVAAYRADQVVHWMYSRGVDDLSKMENLPAELRLMLQERWLSHALDTERLATSVDGTQKLVLRAGDGALIEAVLIPEDRRNTLCVSTQVGCALACSFCATGALGFTRNLRVSEIVDQVCIAQKLLPPEEALTNVVFMGMGEPLMNLPAVLESIRILVHPKAFALAPRRITVSTAGVLGKIRSLLEVGPINLAVSLHATTDPVRDELVPLNRQIPIVRLLDGLRREPLVTQRRPVFFEYTLIEGVNDSLDDARRLRGLLRGIPCKLNVIPMNGHVDSPYGAPSREVMDAFTAQLHRDGFRVTLRRNRGMDIDAACGQLARRESPVPQPDAVSPTAGEGLTQR
jgi:23S rRNA (adenine2503-C2)-methyltransferase